MIFSRNKLCWCGSGKKYKHCHIDKDSIISRLKRKGYLVPPRYLIKTREQIAGIRKSAVLTKNILDMLDGKIKEGITTNQIDGWVYQYTIQNGGYPAPLNYKKYPKSTCTSLNNVICHGIPDETVLREGDIVNVDISTILDGYFSDASRMFTIGTITETAQQLVDCARECLYIGVNSVKPYQPINNIGNAIEPYAKAAGFSVVRDFGGHGIGLKFQEDPFVHHYQSPAKGVILLPGMVFTIEPMINQGSYRCKILNDGWTTITTDGGLSAQWEHTVLVTETGAEILTS